MVQAKHSGKIPPKPGKDVVYLDADDEITAIIDKMEAGKEKVVALVLPKRSASLQSIVNMRLLRRSADHSGKNVVLITKEPALLPLAGAAGLHVAESLQGRPEVPPSPRPGAPAAAAAAELAGDDEEGEEPDDSAKLDYHRSTGQLAAAAEEEDEVSLGDEDADEKPAKAGKAAKTAAAAKIKVPNFDRFRLMLGLGIAGLILLIVFIILAIIVLPKATIAVTTTSEPISANFNLTTSDTAKTLDEAGGVIPASVKSSDFTSQQTVQATGQQNNGNKATGSVTISNCSNSPVTVPSGTGVASSGLTFITQNTLNLDSGNFDSHGNCKGSGSHVGTTNVIAQSGGAKYNLNSASFTVAGYSGTSGSGSTSGGTDNIQTIVSQADLDTAKNKVNSSDTAKFSQNFQNNLTKTGLYLIQSTFKAADPVITSSPSVGQPASTVNVTIKITYSVLAVQKSDLQKILTDKLQKQIKDNTQKINGDVVKGADISVEDQKSPAVATLSVSENTTAVPILNIANIKKQAAGKKTGDISDYVNAIPGVKGVSVKLSPFWVSKAPKASKITVVQQQVKSGG